MQLLADAVDTYRVEDLERWWEWETASDGRRQLTWSTGRRSLRTLAGLDDEATDEEIAKEDQDADNRIILEDQAWRFAVSTRQECVLLRLAELNGLHGVSQWLLRQGLATGGYAPSIRVHLEEVGLT